MISMGSGAGGAMGSYLCGVMRDLSGGYVIYLSICMLSLVFSCMFIWLAGPRRIRRMV